MNTKTYLVTGAAGFIGSAVAKKLIRKGHKIVTIDNLSTGFEENIPDGVVFIKGNCSDEKVINKLDRYKFESIFHIAGQSSGEVSFENPAYDLKTNALSTLLLLQYAQKNKIKKFIYASTMSVYGDQPDKPINEDVITLPKSFYAVGKVASEHYMKLYSNLGITNTVLRLFNVYGPGQNMTNMKQGMVSIFLEQAIKTKKIIVKGSSKRFRDFVFIDDVVHAFIQAERFRDNKYRCFNIGTSIKTTVSQLLKQIIINLPFEIIVDYAASTPGDQFGIYANIEKANTKLNWSPTVSIEKGIKLFCSSTLSR